MALNKRKLKMKKVCKWVTGDKQKFNKKSAAKKHLNVMKAKWQKKRSKK